VFDSVVTPTIQEMLQKKNTIENLTCLSARKVVKEF